MTGGVETMRPAARDKKQASNEMCWGEQAPNQRQSRSDRK